MSWIRKTFGFTYLAMDSSSVKLKKIINEANLNQKQNLRTATVKNNKNNLL